MRALLALLLVAAGACAPQFERYGPGAGGAQAGSSATWPLRGTPAPNADAVRVRPLVVKVAADAAARPQSGLADADLIIEIPVEGGLTRFAVVRRGDRVIGAAMRFGLWLILADGTESAALPLVVEDAVRAQPETPGIVGPKELAREATALWTSRTGTSARLNVAERIYRLERVIAPRPAPGAPRIARPTDHPLLANWFQAFVSESIPGQDASRETAQRNADRWIAGGGLWLWIDGEPVAMAGAGGRTPNGVRISAVYTPPEGRRRGYASSLVAALSQAQLDSGLRYCFLYTDLANPTSNKIYQEIGYEPVSDVDQYSFVPA